MNQPSMLKSAAIGGVAAGIVSSIPIVACLNVACCSLLIGGGFLAGFLYSREVEAAGGTFGAGEGAKLGLLVTPFYAVVSAVLSAAVQSLMGGADPDALIEQIESSGTELPEQARQLIQMVAGGSFVFALIMGLVFGLIFCTLGGVIAGSVFKKEARVAV